jgi:hypothetical protein
MVQTSGTALSSGQRTQYAVPVTPCRGSLLDRALVTVLTTLLRITAPGGPARWLPARRPWRAVVRRGRLEGRALSVVVVGTPADVRQVRLEGRALSVVVVGTPADVRQVLHRAGRRPAAYTIVGVVLDGEVASGDATQDWGEAHRALCYVGIDEVDTAVKDLGADAVVVAGPLTGDDQGLHGPGPGVY